MNQTTGQVHEKPKTPQDQENNGNNSEHNVKSQLPAVLILRRSNDQLPPA
ncbi:MAG TPA: hypothetical protein VIH43_04040 [Chthoniobacterales bacterium]